MSTDPIPSFGDRVRVRSTPETIIAGFAERIGQVYGFTEPSITGEPVIGGELADDLALNVFFEEADEAVWFAPELLQFVDHGAGMELRLDGVPKKWVRSKDGGWDEIEVPFTRPGWIQRLRSWLLGDSARA